MTKIYALKELSHLMEGAPVTYFVCPFHLNIDDAIINYIESKIIWEAPFRTLILTNSHLFTLNLFDKLCSAYDSYEYEYEYNNKIYCFKDKADKGDKKSEVQIFNFSSKKELEKKIRPKYYNRVIFHFVDGNIENYLPQIIPCTNALSFFTLDDEESLFYKLGEEELKNFYRLYDDKSNKKIEELEREGIIDSEKERLLKGLFLPSEKNS